MANSRFVRWSVVAFMLSMLIVTANRTTVNATFFPWPVNPETIRGLTLWLDASDIDGDGNYSNNPTDGSQVSQWKDKSGNSHDARVMSGKNVGTYVGNSVDGINGQPSVRFDRVNDSQGTIFRVPEVDIRAVTEPNITIFTVYRPRTVVANNGVWGSDNGNWDRFFLSYHPAFGNGKTDGIASLGPSQRGAVVERAGVSGTERLLTVVYDGDVANGVNQGPTNGSAVYFNGELVRRFTDSTHPTNAQTMFALGWDGDNSVFDGDIAEVLIYKRVLSDEEIRDVNHYFSEKYTFKIASPDTVPGKPVNLSVKCDGLSATITFVAGADGGSRITNYETSMDGGSTWIPLDPVVVASPLTIGGLTAGVTNDIIIRAVNNIGPGEPSEAVSCSPNVTSTTRVGAPDVPDAPENLKVVESGEMTKVIFDEGDDGGSPITHYEHNIDGDGWREFAPAETSSPVTFHNLDPDERYRIRIRAVNAVGPGAASAAVIVDDSMSSDSEAVDSSSENLDTLPATGSSFMLLLLAAVLTLIGTGVTYLRRRGIDMS